MILSLLNKSTALYRKEFTTLIGYSAWLLLPFAGFVILEVVPDSYPVQVLAFATMIVEFFLIIWVTVVLMLFAGGHLSNQPVDTRHLTEKAKTFIQPFLIITVLQVLILTGGLLLLIVPFFLFLVWFCLAHYCLVFENKHGLEALSASRELTKGRFWFVAVSCILTPLFIVLLYSIILALLVSFVSALQGIDPVELLAGDPPLWIDVLETVGQVFLMPFLVVYMTHVFVFLKESRMSATVEKKV